MRSISFKQTQHLHLQEHVNIIERIAMFLC